MAWGRMKCLDCDHVFDAFIAELKDQRRMLGRVGEPVRHYGDLAQYTGSDPNPRCPECNLQQRMAFWPFIPIVCFFFLIWLAGLAAMMAAASDKIDVEVVALSLWIAGSGFIVSVVFGIVFHSIAKPIRC